MEPTEDSETSAELKRTPGIYPKERTQKGTINEKFLNLNLCAHTQLRKVYNITHVAVKM